MKENKLISLSLKIPFESHKKLKIFAAQQGINLIQFVQSVVVEAAENKELLCAASEKTKQG